MATLPEEAAMLGTYHTNPIWTVLYLRGFVVSIREVNRK